jgi:hypothetical protein
MAGGADALAWPGGQVRPFPTNARGAGMVLPGRWDPRRLDHAAGVARPPARGAGAVLVRAGRRPRATLSGGPHQPETPYLSIVLK